MTKYVKISVLARETAKKVCRGREQWIRYLDVASRLYKYPFEDQLLIYAQRPDATACASLEMWNERMFCWVNRGAKGIALIDGESERPKLRYVFDVSDVHKARRIGKDPFIWHLREEHKEVVLAELEHIYGSTNDALPFENRIYEIAERIAEDFYEEAVDEVIEEAANSFLEDLDGDAVAVRFREMLVQSVSYTILKRCGCDMTEFADDLTFDYIHEFNTLRTLSVLGSTTSELCEPVLIRIGRTIARYDRALLQNRRYTGNHNHTERAVTEHESDIRKEWRLSDSESDTFGAGRNDADEIRSVAEELSEKPQEGDLHGTSSERRTDDTLPGDSGTGRGEVRGVDTEIDEEPDHDGGTETERSAAVDERDEPDLSAGGGDRSEGTGLSVAELEQYEPPADSPYRQLDALNTSLPTGARFVDTMRTITSEELSIFIPFNVQEIHDDLGYCYGFNKVSKNLIIGNRKLLKNGNGMVFGVPGSGKSYNEKSEMGQVLCFSKDDIIVVDPMGEYKDIAAAWGGQYINLTQSAENVFYVNPFHVPDVVPDIDRFVAEKAEFAYAICEQALKPVPLTSRHIAVIDKAVSHMYEEYFKKRKDKRRTRNRPESPTIPVMRDYILEHYEGNEAAQEIVDQLEVFADGTLDIFAREQSISDENRFTVYGFSELGKRMRAMAMLVMIESITAKIKYNQSDGVATWVYVDEMHELWGEEYSLHALEKMWREVRKRGGICTGMSQNLIDAQRNRSTKTMVSNSEFMLLLDQGTMDKEAVEDLFDISSEQLACVNGAEPGMGLIRFGDKIVPFDNTMEKDSSLYQLFNTNFHEMVNDRNAKQTSKK